jgi:glycosyltransferase involved in cell wall biosynthesis
MVEQDKEYLLVTEYFHPDTASTGQLMTELAVGLRDRGLDLTVYTGQPNYHSGNNEQQDQVTVHEGVPVKRIRAPQVRQSSLGRRLFNWLIFTGWMAIALLVSDAEADREVIFVSNPPMLSIAMWMVCRLRGWKYTYIVHDLYPDQPVELGYIKESGLVDRVWSFLQLHAYRDARRIVALGPVMRDRIIEHAGEGFDGDRVSVIHNWADERFITPMSKENNWFSREHDLLDPFTVLSSGNIGEFHDLETVVRAASNFEDRNVQMLIIGEGDNKQSIVDLAEDLGLRGDTVRFLPYQPRDDLPYSLTAADVSVVAVREGFEGVCVSSKLYTAMATGQPVLGIAQPYDDESRIIDAFDAGNHVPQSDVEGVVEAIERWRTNPELLAQQGRNARVAFEQRFTKDRSIDEYYRLLTDEEAPQRAERETAASIAT